MPSTLSSTLEGALTEFKINYLPLDIKVRGASVILKDGTCLLDNVL
jgi:hypothetical protein